VSLRLLVPAAARALREAEDGLTLQELGAAIGTRWPDRVVRAMQRDGYTVGEERGHLHLVVDVGRTVSNPPDPSADMPRGVGAASTPTSAGSKAPGVSGNAGLITHASAGGSLNAGQLFSVEPVEHEPLNPYDPMSDAA
jgi:hypothetical protein